MGVAVVGVGVVVEEGVGDGVGATVAPVVVLSPAISPSSGVGVRIGATNDGTEDEAVDVVVVESAGFCADGGVDVPSTSDVLVATESGSGGANGEEFPELRLTVNCCCWSGVEVATTSAIGWGVSPLTVNCSVGEAKLCQSNVMVVVVAVSSAKVNPAASFSSMNAGMNTPSGEKVTIG